MAEHAAADSCAHSDSMGRNHGVFQRRGGVVRSMLAHPHVLGLTKLGEPRHPLYVLSATQSQTWGVNQ